MDMRLSTHNRSEKGENFLAGLFVLVAFLLAGATLFGMVDTLNKFEPHLIERLVLGGPVEEIDIFDTTVPAQELKDKDLARAAAPGDLIEAQCILNDTPQNNVETWLTIFSPGGNIIYSEAHEIHYYELTRDAARYRFSVSSGWLNRPVKCKLSIVRIKNDEPPS